MAACNVSAEGDGPVRLLYGFGLGCRELLVICKYWQIKDLHCPGFSMHIMSSTLIISACALGTALTGDAAQSLNFQRPPFHPAHAQL